MQAPHASHAEPSQWYASRRLGSNSATAKAGLLLLVSSVRSGWRYLTGLAWICYIASFSRFPRAYRIPQDRIQCEERAGLGRNHVGRMRAAVLARLDSMRLAVVAQHLHIADTDRIPAVRCDGSKVQLRNGRRISRFSPKTIASIRELVRRA